MDDEDSRARRNFLVASTLVILAWWLGVPFDQMSTKFLGFAPQGKTFEWRVWFAAATALIYFALRFWFSEASKKAIADYASDKVACSSRALRRWIRFETAMFVRFGENTPMPVMGTAFRTIAHAAVKKIQVAHDNTGHPARIVRIIVSGATFTLPNADSTTYPQPVWKSGVAFVQFVVRTPHGDDPSLDGAQPLGFELAFLGRTIAWFVSTLETTLFSKSGTGLLLPWWLGVAAMAVAVWKVYAAW
ncbi:hypothetical protein [Variovorax paradoxus]|uniref:hypothetical protein n=1 Tax=Variovorax paradoxus TaxID=34073 RepID=UPI002864160B|nr:hypothetical protein [Variovorax paradoxus]MDR6453909.1 hypothetical protein [Variovorax paradoxus]